MSSNLLITSLGWTGSVLYLLAYALVSLKKAEGDSMLYQGINIVAGVFLVIYTIYLGAFANTFTSMFEKTFSRATPGIESPTGQK